MSFVWHPLFNMLAAGLSVVLFTRALVLSIRARAPQSMLVWGLCLLVGFPYTIMIGLYGLGWIDRGQYLRYVAPLSFPAFIVIWVLPCLEWTWRLTQANQTKVRNVSQDTQ